MRFIDFKVVTASLALLVSTWSYAGQLSLATSPLAVSTNALPNIMLLIDTSGSMNAIIESDGYNAVGPDINAVQWEYRSGGQWPDISVTKSYYFPSSFSDDGCNNGFARFRQKNATATTKCLKLPKAVAADGTSLGNNTRYSGGYLTYLLNTYPSGTDLTTGTIPTGYRMDVAREVAKQLVNDTNPSGSSKARFGLAKFNTSNDGATILAACNQDTSESTGNDILDSIDDLTAVSWTPLAEALYEVTRYFRGMSSYYTDNKNYTSPIQYRCQQNFTIVITDGFPTNDSKFPNNDPFDQASAKSLPNWDGITTDPDNPEETLESQYPSFPKYSDGFSPNSNSSSSEGATLYLDDIALFAQEIDLKPDGAELDADGKSYNDPEFLQQNLNTYTVGFGIQNQMLIDAAEYGTGESFLASNQDQLLSALTAAVNAIIARSGAAASAAASSGSVQEGTKVYQARFNSGDWSGQLLSFEFDADGNLDTSNVGVAEGALWDAGANIPSAHTNRNIFTVTEAGAAPFRWGQFSTAEQDEYFDSNQDVLLYIRGESFEDFRYRSTLLGDIVSSTPKFVGAPNSNYLESFEAGSYAAFKTAHANRETMIYVGANDGMLHGFSAEDGTEQMAFIPSAVLSNLSLLTDPEYSHQYYVDGTPTIRDAYIGGEWKSVLVGGLNLGGKSIYALDVTDPSSFSESPTNAENLVLWEFSHENLGYTYSQPLIVKLHDGDWYAVFGSGYNPDAGTDGDARIFLVNLETGELVKTLSTETGSQEDPKLQGRPNGFGKIAPVDLNSDNVVDYIYAGDLFGNLWKFDLSSSSRNDWALDYKLFEACSGTCATGVNDNHQAITTQPIVGSHTSGKGVMVYFGTGKYLETSDNNGAGGGIQTIYGVWDQGASVSGRNQLLEQSIVTEAQATFVNDQDTEATGDDVNVDKWYRIISSNLLSLTDSGWYMDLVSPANGEEGERLISDMVLRRGILYFNTSIPEADTCKPTGVSWFMAINAINGSATYTSPFDYNNDGVFDDDDKVSDAVASGIRSDSNAMPVILAGEDSDTVIGNGSCDDGDSCIQNIDKGEGLGRQSWRQLFR